MAIGEVQRKMKPVLTAILPAAILYAVVATMEVGARTTCSCYTYSRPRRSWTGSRQECQKTPGQDLVSMETMGEWEFIKNAIQNKSTGNRFEEWHIGLYGSKDTGKWTWVSGQPLTIDRWQPNKPDDEKFTLIARNYPQKYQGRFNSITDHVFRACICENTTSVTGKCTYGCWTHPTPSTTTTSSPSSTTQAHTNQSQGEGSTPSSPQEPSSAAPQTGDKSSLVLILAVVLGVLFAVVAVVLGFILFRRHKRSRKRLTEDAEDAKQNHDELQNEVDAHYENISRKQEAAKLLGAPKENETSETYEEIGDRRTTPNDTYAAVDKTKKQKKNKEELCYAELGAFDGEDDGAAEPPEKTAPYNATVYAEVVGTVASGSDKSPDTA